jgi:acetoin utilization deacetylase AcuC-like enzyme
MNCAYFYNPLFALHDMGAGHPECPQRVQVIDQALRLSGWLAAQQGAVHCANFDDAPEQALLAVHTDTYLRQLTQSNPQEGLVSLDADTALNRHSLAAARRAAGAGVAAIDGLVAGQFKRAFCNVRPPGHHAEPDHAMGFCIFNNVAITAKYAQVNGFDRVAVLDWDVHHGNGTETMLANQPGLLMLGSFQHPFYPGGGVPNLASNTLNEPLPAGSDGSSIRAVVKWQWWPALTAFKPQLIIISAGFDAHIDDAMSGLRWSDDDYAWLTAEVVAMANTFCDGKIVSILEGGYDLSALARCTKLHMEQLLT